MKCLALATVLLALSSLLAACGQKGPLVLPDAQPKHKRTLPLSSPVKPKDDGSAPAESRPEPAPPPDQPPPPSAFNGAAAAPLTTPR